jgi:hypothetical protein
MVNPKAYSLVVSLPIGDEGEGEGTLEELEFRHHLEDVLNRVLRKQRLGHVDGGGQGGGYQDVFMYVYPQSWEQAWGLVRAKLTEMELLERALVTAGLEEGQPAHELWPPSQANTAQL